MNIRQSFYMAIRNLCVNKIRFAQALLAMVVGMAGVVVVLTLGFTLLNVNDLFFEQYTPGTFSSFIDQNAADAKAVDETDMERLARDNPELIKAITPLVQSGLPISLRSGNRVCDEAKLYGVDEDYIETYNGLYVQEGRFLQSMDISREQRVCVIGRDIAEVLFDGEALGESLRVFGENYQVVGVLSDLDQANNELLIPYTRARKIFGEDIRTYNSNKFYDDQYIVVAQGEENMLAAKQLIEDMLREKTGGETGSVWDYGTRWRLSTYASSMLKEMMKGSIFAYFYFRMLALGAVLLISCVGIMNVMLASVQERVQEIAIRRAFGATNKDIKRQFTMEAVATSLLGGALGVALGLGALVIMAWYGVVLPVGGYQVNFADMNWLTLSLPILVALVACVGVGVLSAAYPARQAAKLEIVEALNEG